jgi:hypothetical protein
LINKSGQRFLVIFFVFLVGEEEEECDTL